MAKQKTVQEAASGKPPNPNHEKFARQFVSHGNATVAYMRTFNVGYNTARAEGSRLTANPNIQELIERFKAEDAIELDVSRRDILMVFAKVMKHGERDKDRMEAARDLWDKLGFAKAPDGSGDDSVAQAALDALERLASGPSKKDSSGAGSEGS